jgi:hypothetical protein
MNRRSFAASLNWRRSSDRTFCFLGGPAYYKVIGNFRKNKKAMIGLLTLYFFQDEFSDESSSGDNPPETEVA